MFFLSCCSFAFCEVFSNWPNALHAIVLLCYCADPLLAIALFALSQIWFGCRPVCDGGGGASEHMWHSHLSLTNNWNNPCCVTNNACPPCTPAPSSPSAKIERSTSQKLGITRTIKDDPGHTFKKSYPNFRDMKWNAEENYRYHKKNVFRVVSRFLRYISCYISENRLPLGQCIAGTNGIVSVIDDHQGATMQSEVFFTITSFITFGRVNF